MTPYVPDAGNAPQTADAADASADCLEASTATEVSVCAAPGLIAANRAMVMALQQDLRAATVFQRDPLLAGQRAWLLALPGRCGLPALPAKAPGAAEACLQAALVERTGALHGMQPAPVAGLGKALVQYVSLHASAGAAAQPDAGFCTGFAARANAALERTGSLDPAAMGTSEVAGTHGAAAAGPVRVDLYDANVFALFQRRARGVSVGGVPVLTPVSLTGLVAAQSPANQGGRFSSFASQTGDYGTIDVFRDGGRLLAMAADPWGSTSPAAPGEASHLGLWDISAGKAAPVCLFDTYTRPAEPGPMEALPGFSAWREALAAIRDSASPELGTGMRRDQAQLAADADFTVLHMPLLALAQAVEATRWLRRRHDDALDALFAWSAQNPDNKVLFDRAFALMRPAAMELVRAYQNTQGLSAAEATQAGGSAVMELVYQATTTLAPGLGDYGSDSAPYRPRYPILAAPQ